MDELKMNLKKCTDINFIKKLNVSELFEQDVSLITVGYSWNKGRL